MSKSKTKQYEVEAEIEAEVEAEAEKNKDGFEVGSRVSFEELNKHISEQRKNSKGQAVVKSKNSVIESIINEHLYRLKVRLNPRDLESLADTVAAHYEAQKDV